LAKSPKIRKPTTEPVEYEPCIVAFIDVLGFRDLVNSRSAADVQDAISALQHFTAPDKEELSKSDRRLFSQAQARSVSDAVVRIRPYVTEYRDGALIHEILDPLKAQIELVKLRVLVRGGLTVGEARVGSSDRDPVFGPAMIRAYDIESKEVLFPRIVVDDDALLREGLASLLERSGFDVVGRVGNGTEALALVRTENPDLLVIDIRMPPSNTTEGLDAARAIREEFPDIGILVLSAHVDVEHAMELLASGRSIGYLLKNRVTDVADFVDTLERIANGASVVDPALVSELVSARRRDDPLAALSAREREVLAQMAEGRSNAGIAQRLWVTEGTVEKHVRSILTKLDLAETGDDHRRVLAVITFLESR